MKKSKNSNENLYSQVFGVVDHESIIRFGEFEMTNLLRCEEPENVWILIKIGIRGVFELLLIAIFKSDLQYEESEILEKLVRKYSDLE